MKHSLLRLISSFYILLISGLMIVISAYAWMVISDSPAAGGIGFGIAGLDEWDIPEVIEPTYDYMDETLLSAEDVETFAKNENGAYLIDSAEKFVALMQYINGNAALQGDISMVLQTHISLEDHEMLPDAEGNPIRWDADVWQAVEVQGYTGTGVVSIFADDALLTETEMESAFIKGLSKPLFVGGFAGSSGIAIEDVTIFGSTILSENTLGSGAFIECVDSMQEITLRNCHLLNSKLIGGSSDESDYARVGGLIGWTSGYNNANDGPVKTYVYVEECSVRNSEIVGSSVGGIIGHSGANAWTFTQIRNCIVENNILSSKDSGAWRVGEIVGTANVGETTIVDAMASGNTRAQIGQTPPAAQNSFYGRVVPGTTGKLAIVDPINANIEVYGGFIQDSAYELIDAEVQTWYIYGNISLPEEFRFQGNEINVVGRNNATITLNSIATGYVWQGLANSSSGFNYGDVNDYTNDTKQGSFMSFEDITFINSKKLNGCTSSANRSTSYTYAYADHVDYVDCVFEGGVVVYGDAFFEGCSFRETDSNRYCLFLDNQYGGRKNSYAINNCTFESKAVTAGNTTTAAYGCIKVADDANSGATLLLKNSVCYNDTAKPAVYINGTTAVITDGNNKFYSAGGGILAKGSNCTLNGEVCLTTGEYEAAKADPTKLAEYDLTEFGNNGNAVSVFLTESEEIIETISKETLETTETTLVSETSANEETTSASEETTSASEETTLASEETTLVSETSVNEETTTVANETETVLEEIFSESVSAESEF